MAKLPPSLEGLKFTFFQTNKGKIPNTCPPVYKKGTDEIVNQKIIKDDEKNSMYPATDKYTMLGTYVAYKILKRGFDDDPRYDYLKYWKDQCGSSDTEVRMTEDELVEKLDKMQRENLGDLTTGATTLLGYIGQKAVLDGNMEMAGKIYDKLVDYADHVESEGFKSKSCSGKVKKENCEDSLSRVFLGIGKMTTAAIKSGRTDGQRASQELLRRTLTSKALGDKGRATGAQFKNNPYEHGVNTLYRCMIESDNGSLKRDQCMEMIKDVAVEAIIADEKEIYEDGLEHLGGWYYDPEKEPKKWKGNVETWVNSTIWMTDGLIRLLKYENARGKRLNGTSKLIDTIAAQKVEGLEEFSTADWIVQQANIITAKGNAFNRHEEIIEKINEDRLSIWNPWLDVYLGMKDLDPCPEDYKVCMGDETSDRNVMFKQLSKSILKGCLKPIADKKSFNDVDKKSLEICSKAVSSMIEKVGDDKTLRVVTEPYFWFGQEDGGYKYLPKFKEIVKEGFNKRFTPTFVSKMDGKTRMTEKETPGTAEEIYKTWVFSNRLFNKDDKRNYFLKLTMDEQKKTKAELVRSE